jgi:hypothetical protein
LRGIVKRDDVDISFLSVILYLVGDNSPTLKKRNYMTGSEEICRIISGDERYVLVGEKNYGNNATIFFAPRKRVYSRLELEEMVRRLFEKVPERSGIYSTHGGIVAMNCSERLSDDPKIPLRSINVQCFLSEEDARKDYGPSTR